jgi:membrane-bound metal-dependent hydrolase YbcI (DUF457 family)
MAGFKTHITVSSLVGVGYGTAAHLMFDVPMPTCVLAGGLCSVSGMLPDIDSDSGVPLRETIAFAAAIVPMMVVDRLKALELSSESIVLAAALFYLLIRFAFAELVKRLTVHRGMFHSIPVAIIFGEVAFLLASGSTEMRLYKAGGVLLGFLSHLLLDELYSVEWRYGLLRLKRSFGTAVKLWGDRWLGNIATFLVLGLLTFVAVYEPTWMRTRGREQLQRTADGAVEQIERTTETTAGLLDRMWR